MTNNNPTQPRRPDAGLRLSPHFTLREMTVSGTALRHHIDNMPPPAAVARLEALCLDVLEPLRRRFGAIRVTSGYRCPELNRLVGGRERSQHLLGEAADLHVPGRETGLKMFRFLRDSTPFDQLLFEHAMDNGCCWLHVSHKRGGGNRHEAIASYPAW